MSKSENDDLSRAITRALEAKDGSVIKEELEYYANKETFSENPYEMAYNVGQQALARWLLNLAKPK